MGLRARRKGSQVINVFFFNPKVEGYDTEALAYW